MPNEQQPQSQEQKDFVKKTEEHRREKVEELAYQALLSALEHNIAVFDLPYYVLARARLIIEEAIKSVDFDNPELRAARKEYLKKCLKQIRKNIPAQVKKEELDETDVRDNKCEPVANRMVELLLDPSLIFSDAYFFEAVLKDEEKIPLISAVSSYAGALDEKMMMIISNHWKKATEKMFGVEKEKLTFQQLKDIIGE